MRNMAMEKRARGCFNAHNSLNIAANDFDSRLLFLPSPNKIAHLNTKFMFQAQYYIRIKKIESSLN